MTDLAAAMEFLTPEDRADLLAALKDVAGAARELDSLFGMDGDGYRLAGEPVGEDVGAALLSLHDYLNDVNRIALELRAVSIVRQQETIHERHACPRCMAAMGNRCRRVGSPLGAPTLKHSHRERIRLELPDR